MEVSEREREGDRVLLRVSRHFTMGDILRSRNKDDGNSQPATGRCHVFEQENQQGADRLDRYEIEWRPSQWQPIAVEIWRGRCDNELQRGDDDSDPCSQAEAQQVYTRFSCVFGYFVCRNRGR